MGKYIAVALAVFALGFSGVWVYMSNAAHEEARVEARKQKDQTNADITNAIHGAASEDNAIINWSIRLSPTKSYRTTPLLTAEVQQVWVTGHPILFIGKLNDITRNTDGTYQIFVEYTTGRSRPRFVSTELNLRADCSASLGESLLDWMKNSSKRWTEVAVTATIHSVEASQVTDADAIATSVLTGRGDCINLMVLPTVNQH